MRRKLVAILVTAAITGLGGVALAAEGARPHVQTDPPTSDQSSSSQQSDESASDASDDSTESPESESPDSESPDSESDSASDAGKPDKVKGVHPQNHGAAVSKAAHDCPTGDGHGACVSAVAHQK